MPQLIVALDSLCEDANYVHINDVKEDVTYYCPCCKSVVKPRAYKHGVDYQMQPHFYHESGGCNEETYVHYICKNWLLDKGVIFLVNGIEYEVNSIETEKILHTSFGDYRPDIIITTTNGKIFYFEIKSTNRKTELYAPKWDELGNDVVEVDVRDFINQKVQSDIPIFNLIYSDGECFIKSYTKKDYDEIIAIRKKEWKRQDKLNYKIQWERLDWFWETLVSYKRNKNNIEDVLIAFENLDFSDKDFVMAVVKKMKCQELFDSFVSIINKAFWDEIKKIDISPYEGVSLKQESPGIFYIGLQLAHFADCYWYYSTCIRKYFHYYGNEILSTIRDMLAKKMSGIDLECHDYFYKYFQHNLIKNVKTRFYLTDRPMVYLDYQDGITYYSDSSRDYLYPSMSMYYTFNNKRYKSYGLTQFLLDDSLENQYSVVKTSTKDLVDRINTSKNNCWCIQLKKYTDRDSLDHIYFKLQLMVDGYQFYTRIFVNALQTQETIFNKIKNTMNDMLLNPGYYASFKYYKRCQDMRIIIATEAPNGK